MSETIEQVAAEVLAEHGLYLSLINQRCICTCGENYPQGSTLTAQAAHRAHVAQQIAARLDDGLRVRVRVLADVWSGWADAPIDHGPGFSVRPIYRACAIQLRTLLDQTRTEADR